MTNTTTLPVNNSYFGELKQGWKTLLLCVVGISSGAWAIPTYSFSALANSLVAEFGWTQTQVQIAATVNFIAMTACLPLCGWLVKRVALFRLIVCSIILFSINLVLLSYQQGSLTLFYLNYATLQLCGLGTYLVVWSLLINYKFNHARGMALAILLSGTGFVGMTLPAFTTWMIETFSWRAAYQSLAAIPLIVLLPIVLIFRDEIVEVFQSSSDSNSHSSLLTGLTLRQAFSNYRYWVLVIVVCPFILVHVGFLFNMIPVLTAKGVSTIEAASIAGMFGVGLTVGRLGAGYLIDHLWAPGVAVIAMMLPAIAWYLLLQDQSTVALLMLAVFIVGLGGGVEMDVVSFLVVKYFGLLDYSQIYASLLTVTGIASSIGPLAFGLVVDSFGSYDPILYFGLGCFTLLPPLLLLFGKYPKFESVI